MSKVVLPIHGADHCPGGPDPIPCLGGGGTSVAVLGGLDFIDSGSGLDVPADTWQVAASAGVDRKFYWGFYTGDEPAWSLDGEAGSISRNEGAMYVAYLRIMFQDNVAGEIIGCGLHFGHASRFFKTTRPVEASGSGSVDITIPYSHFSSIGVTAYVYSSVANVIGINCEFHVRRFEPHADLEYVEFD